VHLPPIDAALHRPTVDNFDGTAIFADKQAIREQYGKLFADSSHVVSSHRRQNLQIDAAHVTSANQEMVDGGEYGGDAGWCGRDT
jgi:hypothetical protein